MAIWTTQPLPNGSMCHLVCNNKKTTLNLNCEATQCNVL